MESLQPLTHRIIPSANRDELASLFPFCIYLISFSSIISLAKASSPLLNKTEESRHPHLSLDLWKKCFQVSPFVDGSSALPDPTAPSTQVNTQRLISILNCLAEWIRLLTG